MRSSYHTFPLSVAAACLFASSFAGLPTHAQEFAPTYSRQRMHADGARRRGDSHGFSGHRGGYSNSYYNPYFYSPVVVGSYYQRPYPYHFDYYRHRWGQPHVNYGPEYPQGDPDCPCAVEAYSAPSYPPQDVSAPAAEPAPTAPVPTASS